jgi:hypothetical protein
MTSNKKAFFEEQIKNAAPKNEKPPPPQKQRSWTPHAVEEGGHLDSAHYNKQTATKKGYKEILKFV